MIRTNQTFICQLSEAEQAEISRLLTLAQIDRGHTAQEAESITDEAMCCRLWSVEDVIDIEPYLSNPPEPVNVAEWSRGNESAIQCVVFSLNAWCNWQEDRCETMSGLQATKELRQLIRCGVEPIEDERGIYGFRDGLSRVEYWDCDEFTFGELGYSYED